jgi:hypothetical protein
MNDWDFSGVRGRTLSAASQCALLRSCRADGTRRVRGSVCWHTPIPRVSWCPAHIDEASERDNKQNLRDCCSAAISEVYMVAPTQGDLCLDQCPFNMHGVSPFLWGLEKKKR